MLFKDALSKLEKGIPMNRKSWLETDGYLKLMPGMGYVWKIVLLPNPNAGNFIFAVEDFRADDWQEYKVPVKETSESIEVVEG